jgi:hypothetical protein
VRLYACAAGALNSTRRCLHISVHVFRLFALHNAEFKSMSLCYSNSNKDWGISSHGRTLRSQRRGNGIDTRILQTSFSIIFFPDFLALFFFFFFSSPRILWHFDQPSASVRSPSESCSLHLAFEFVSKSPVSNSNGQCEG